MFHKTKCLYWYLTGRTDRAVLKKKDEAEKEKKKKHLSKQYHFSFPRNTAYKCAACSAIKSDFIIRAKH